MNKEILQQALEALDLAQSLLEKSSHHSTILAAYTALAEAIAQPVAIVSLIEECRDALAEELAGWDLDPPLYHVKQAHDKCEAWLRNNAAAQPVQTAIAAQAGQSEPVARVAASFLGRADVLLCNGENVLPFGTELYTHPAPTIAQPVEVQPVQPAVLQPHIDGWTFVPIGDLRELYHSIHGNQYMGEDWEKKAISSMMPKDLFKDKFIQESENGKQGKSS